MTPCLVICRDRVSYTRLCVASLERFSADVEIHLVDHGSTWPPMLDYLAGSPHPVHRCPDQPPHALWQWSRLAEIVGVQRYLVTDPDIVFDDDCPPDWLQRLGHELDYGDLRKAGLGLRIDDLPAGEIGATVRNWEQWFWKARRPSGAWSAPVDTTLALYAPLPTEPGFGIAPAARLDAPYLIRHLPWYSDLDPEESDHYRHGMHPGSSHWINGGW